MEFVGAPPFPIPWGRARSVDEKSGAGTGKVEGCRYVTHVPATLTCHPWRHQVTGLCAQLSVAASLFPASVKQRLFANDPNRCTRALYVVVCVRVCSAVASRCCCPTSTAAVLLCCYCCCRRWCGCWYCCRCARFLNLLPCSLLQCVCTGARGRVNTFQASFLHFHGRQPSMPQICCPPSFRLCSSCCTFRRVMFWVRARERRAGQWSNQHWGLPRPLPQDAAGMTVRRTLHIPSLDTRRIARRAVRLQLARGVCFTAWCEFEAGIACVCSCLRCHRGAWCVACCMSLPVTLGYRECGAARFVIYCSILEQTSD